MGLVRMEYMIVVMVVALRRFVMSCSSLAVEELVDEALCLVVDVVEFGDRRLGCDEGALATVGALRIKGYLRNCSKALISEVSFRILG